MRDRRLRGHRRLLSDFLGRRYCISLPKEFEVVIARERVFWLRQRRSLRL
jgi:hypothetical protein